MLTRSRSMLTALTVLLSGVMTYSAVAADKNSPVAAVNVFIGTGGDGHTFPGATRPFGMVQLSPDTQVRH